MPKTRFVPCVFALLLPLVFWCVPIPAWSTETDTSLSPHFFVESENGAEENGENFPLLDTRTEVNISGVIAQVTVRQKYANRGGQPIHARYIFPGSTRAAVHGLTMTVGERVIRAQIKERQAAQAVYEQAKQEGKSAALLSQERPNVFSMAVANILPGDVIDVELVYTELLLPENGVYEFVYPTVVGPRYSGAHEDPAKSQWVKNPYLKKDSAAKTGFAIHTRLAAGMPVKDISCPSHAVQVDYESPDTANINLSGQDFGGDRDFILRYRLDGDAIATGLMLFAGRDENFFLLMAQPPRRPAVNQIPPREYIFVVDVSGSMVGFPLDTAKTLLTGLINSLRPEDRFNMVFFAGGNQVMAPAPVAATTDNVQAALAMLNNFKGGGGTELLPALRTAMAMPADEGVSRSVLVITDGYVSAEKEAFSLIRENLGHSNLFAFGIGSAVNRHLIEGLAMAGSGEPFILTDPGEAPAMTKRFCEYISAPVLTDIKVAYEGFDAYDVEPTHIPDLFSQRPLLVFGKWRGPRDGKIVISGVNGEGAYSQSFAPGEVQADEKNAGLRTLWARNRLARLSDYGQGESVEQKAAIVNLGLAYNLLTAHTSFVAVDEVVRNAGGAGKEVKQPLSLPKGVSELAVPGRRVPEPEFWLLTLAALVTVWRLIRKNGASCLS
ncbi:MAG: VWA domain-containing protein [Desulfobulbus sp.]|uniref:VIT domain-containing protein n=1 Tax=Desulfobulbus sp. TaxID=895 RepID=UPI00283AD8FD|nr:VIT domain-containing protein [Desulfobulbus sp.]MDR2549176.1 VWA domain-containing protein [Desulfobulbus sp.]